MRQRRGFLRRLTVAALPAALLMIGCSALPQGHFAVVPAGVLAARIMRASSVTLTAYMLAQSSAVTRALRTDGGRATVLFDGYSFGAARRDAQATAQALRESGVTVLWSRSYWHLKSAIVDSTLYLDTENFGRNGILVRDH